MELVDGEDLATILRRIGRAAAAPGGADRGRRWPARSRPPTSARLVHRDVKPGNILIGRDGRVKVADFGIARAVAEAQMTLPGTTLGSVHYFSPEQARGEPATAASDIFTLGIVLFEMLTGRRPWEGDSAAGVALARLTGPTPDPADPPPVRAARAFVDHPPGTGPRSDRSLSLGRDDGRCPRRVARRDRHSDYGRCDGCGGSGRCGRRCRSRPWRGQAR